MLCIIGCGNPTRSDDGVGVVVARRLMANAEASSLVGVRIFDAGTGGMDVMFRARGSKQLILIDACRSGSEPGAVFCVPGNELEAVHEPSYSLHDFRWDHAIYAGRKIFGADFPSDVTVYLIEAQDLGYGLELSEPVECAAVRVTAQILERLAKPTDSQVAVLGMTMRVARGSFYLDAELVSRHFVGVEAVAPLLREGHVYLLPLHGATAGGVLLKRLNARGDRVAHATEFFLRSLGIEGDSMERLLPARWDESISGLQIDGLTSQGAEIGK